MRIFHEGKLVPLGHMTQRMEILCPCEQLERDLKIRVTFQNHCYTQKYDPNVHKSTDICLTEGKDRHRVFCPIRYALSHKLPSIVKELPSKKVLQTSQARNYVYAVRLELENKDYEIYFMLQLAQPEDEADLRLTVESAYPNGSHNFRKRPNQIRFAVLAHKVLTRQTVRFAPR